MNMGETDNDSENKRPQGLFFEMDEDDPFEKVELKAISENDVGISIGTIAGGPGRYELRKVSDDDE